MTTFQSESHHITADSSTIDGFLANLENLTHLLPTERIEDVELSKTSASFKIKGLAEINISLDSSSSERVVYKNTTNKPFGFTLEVAIQSQGESSDCQVFFNADVNSFMGMMMKTPITNFLNDLGQNLGKHFQST